MLFSPLYFIIYIKFFTPECTPLVYMPKRKNSYKLSRTNLEFSLGKTSTSKSAEREKELKYVYTLYTYRHEHIAETGAPMGEGHPSYKRQHPFCCCSQTKL